MSHWNVKEIDTRSIALILFFWAYMIGTNWKLLTFSTAPFFKTNFIEEITLDVIAEK